MHLQKNRYTGAVYCLLILICTTAFHSNAQPGNQPFTPADLPLHAIVPVARDSAASVSATATQATGAGSALAKYARANQLHASMIDSLTKVLFRNPMEDSAGLNFAREWIGTPNMGLRKPNFVIIHHTATRNCEDALREFTTPGGREVSAHYLICRDGTVHYMLNDLLRSHHAGESKWGNNTDLNSGSIGIELDNNGTHPFTEPQLASLYQLLGRLKEKYKIPVGNFIGHADIAPARKADPSHHFPWKDISQMGFGLWWDDTTGVEVPDSFDYLLGLRIIGYDVSYPASAVAAFKRHFMGDHSGGSMNAVVRKIIYVLHRKYM